jgi:AcrR family transcriptional regulator
MRQAERRARTSRRLLDAAAEVFARRGFHAATVDDVAEAAGHTKGAVYAHFASKDALFLALLDRHLDDQLAQVDRLVGERSPDELQSGLQEAAARAMTNGGGSPLGPLMLEFWLYAARDARARDALAERYQRMRERLAATIAARDTARGLAAARAATDVATLVLALDAGLFVQHLIDPATVDPELRARALAAVIDPPAP